MADSSGPKYTVYVDDNFHYMDEDERYTLGVYDTCEAATEKCREIVDDFLAEQYKQGMSAQDLLQAYTGFGEDPWISGPDSHCRFSAWTYAEIRCREICVDRNKS